MDNIANLSGKIEQQLPAELISFIKLAAGITDKRGQNLYLIGGAVRDLLLDKPNLDLDLVVAGNAIDLARQLVEISPGKITTHPHFGTAKIQYEKWNVDLTTARSETYTKPGALPKVSPGNLRDDLFRRDFTINAMAVRLNHDRYGELIDLYSGRQDLEHRLVRILHEKSFIDDATRIWRALRYEQRLGFQIETATLRLLQRDIPMLDTISGDRIRYELECILQEQYPEKVIRRAEELGVLARLHPSLKGSGWLAAKFEHARLMSSPETPPMGVYLALLTYPLTGEELEKLISYLRLPKKVAQIIRDTTRIKDKLHLLADPDLTASSVYSLLHEYSSLALSVNSIVSDSPVVKEHINQFLNELRYVKCTLTGKDIIRMGYANSPRITEILHRLHMAKLDGQVTSKQDEERMAREWHSIS
ncbi:CCA tRNA nucleotidyltransferase [Chloroflexota bacterium]